MNKRPNILFIMTDQQRYDTFSCVNNEIYTPHLDKLIKDSVHFLNARCTNPSCVPSRAAIMTGKYPSQCQCPMYITKLPKDEITFMSRLREAGYYTAVIGKQHFAGSEIDRGYIEEDIIDGHGTFAEEKQLGSYLDYLKKNGINPQEVSETAYISGAQWKTKTKYHIDYYIGELGKEWLLKRAQKKDDQPWFFTLSFPGPHHPYDGEGTEFSELYALDKIKKPSTSYEDLLKKPPHYREMDRYSHIYLKDYSEKDFLHTKCSYYSNISLIDKKVGEVIDILKKNGMYDNTLIIYTSDHGDFMGDYGMVEKLQCLSDSLMRVPLFVKPPIANFLGKKVDDLVLNLDIAATCLKAAGVEIPQELSNYPYQRYWEESTMCAKRDVIYMEAGNIKGCICGNIKVVHYMERNYGEMYDLEKDALEINNLWDDPEYQDKKIEAYRNMMNFIYKATPHWSVPWNIGTPEI